MVPKLIGIVVLKVNFVVVVRFVLKLKLVLMVKLVLMMRLVPLLEFMSRLAVIVWIFCEVCGSSVRCSRGACSSGVRNGWVVECVGD